MPTATLERDVPFALFLSPKESERDIYKSHGQDAARAWAHLLFQDFHLFSFLEGQVIWVDAIVRVQGYHNVPLLLWI